MKPEKHRAVQMDMFHVRPTMADGIRARDQAKRRLSTENQEWLDRARSHMAVTIREKGFCSSDDCWERCPPPESAHPSVMGCLFDDRRFVRVGDRLSTRPSARGRRISTYELKGEINAYAETRGTEAG
jgi:hypothetical protein